MITIILPEGPGADVSLIAGKGSPGYSDGSINFRDADDKNIISIHSDKTITILGKTFSLETIVKALDNFEVDSCNCPMNQLLTKGCSCGGK